MITLPELSARASTGPGIDLTCLVECMIYCWPLLLVVSCLNTLKTGEREREKERMNEARGMLSKSMYLQVLTTVDWQPGSDMAEYNSTLLCVDCFLHNFRDRRLGWPQGCLCKNLVEYPM